MNTHVTIFYPKTDINSTFFDINATPYKFVDSYNGEIIDFYAFCGLDTEILNPFLKKIPRKKNLIIDLSNNEANQLRNSRCSEALADENTWIITNAFPSDVEHPRLLQVDFLFNRTKAYYSQFPFRESTKKWYYHGIQAYQDIQLTSAEQKKKIFVAPCKTYKFQGLRWYRHQLFTFLLNHTDQGYLGNHPDTEHVLYAHAEFPWNGYTIDDLEEHHKEVGQEFNYQWFDYIPPHNAYYQNTFLSVYTESIETGKTIAVTEKTYDPLLKGHFILPFSCAGYIRHIRKIGIKLPGFIDYTYDDIEDDTLRYRSFQDELQRLLSLDLDTWKMHWQSNYELIYQNKMWFHQRDYDRVDLFGLLK